MSTWLKLPSAFTNILLLGLILAFALTIVAAVAFTPAPQLTFEYAGATIEVSADRAWVLFPNDCLKVRWVIDGNLPIHIDGGEWHESAEQQFCPTVSNPHPLIEMTDHRRGDYHSHRLQVFFLPEFLLHLVGVAAIPVMALIAIQYLWINDIRKCPAYREVLLATLILLICIALARLSGRELTIETMLSFLRNLFASKHWLPVGVAWSALLYIPLVVYAIRYAIKQKPLADIFAVSGFALFVVVLYLPFGLDTVAQWDEWTFRAYLENMPWPKLHRELTSRPLLLASSVIGTAISSESFVGLNLVYAFLLWTKPAMLYGILRQFHIRRLYAFLVTVIFLVYPVDSRLLSGQAINLQLSFVALLTAIYLVLRYARNPNRSSLVGIFLALGLCVGIYESAYALIAVIPLLWWYRIPNKTWQNLNLTIIWYIVPASKVVYLLLLLSTRRSFYQSDFFYTGSEISLSDLFSQIIGRLLEVYLRTFAFGWIDAIRSLWRNPWLPLTVLMLALLGTLVWLIWRTDRRVRVPEKGRLGLALLAGLLLIPPAVGVLIWIDSYNNDFLGLYLYIPVGGAIAVFCLVALVTSPLANRIYRNIAIAGLCLLLMLPALSRLLLQHEHYVNSANNKARILAQIVQLAPAIESQTRVLVLSEMSSEDFQDKHIEAFASSTLGHALYVIYEGQGSARGSICLSVDNCFPLIHRKEFLTDTIVFTMDRDLNLELVTAPETMLEEYVGLDYDLSRLYYADAAVPSRAYSMLGLTEA